MKNSRVIRTKSRFGLPQGFVPRLQRDGSSTLLEHNIYRLPDGREFVPIHPTGFLGRPSHLYALVSLDQYQRSERGSVYIRTDRRIFDYSVDNIGSGREMFDTGYAMKDLERTGRYAGEGKSDAVETVSRDTSR